LTRELRSSAKCDPEHVALARERWSEHATSGEMLIEAAGKYDVTRTLPKLTRAMIALPEAA
jgi:hypothetical protein